MTIINLTQHQATAEQVAQGVIDLQGSDLATLKNLILSACRQMAIFTTRALTLRVLLTNQAQKLQ